LELKRRKIGQYKGRNEKGRGLVGGRRFEECQVTAEPKKRKRPEGGRKDTCAKASAYKLHLPCTPSTFQFQFLLLNQNICINSRPCKNI